MDNLIADVNLDNESVSMSLSRKMSCVRIWFSYYNHLYECKQTIDSYHLFGLD